MNFIRVYDGALSALQDPEHMICNAVREFNRRMKDEFVYYIYQYKVRNFSVFRQKYLRDVDL